MIIFASGRTDIVAFYMKWLLNRFNEGFVDVRNPFFESSVSRIYFTDVDAIVFCTKNPIPLLLNIDKIKKPMILHVTITPYLEDIEPNVFNKKEIIAATKEIASLIGDDKVFIRYDPILFNDKYTFAFHLNAFEKLCQLVEGSIKHFVISFIDIYKNVIHNMSALKLKNISDYDIDNFCNGLMQIGNKYHIDIRPCGENIDPKKYGFINEGCISRQLIYSLTNKKFKKMNNRKNINCDCVRMADIGYYNSCPHHCKYCYANYDENRILNNIKMHDDNSSLLIGHLQKEDIIKIRRE